MNRAIRIDYLDTLKGIAILLVIIGHCLAWNYADFLTIIFDGKRSDMFWWHLIYSFHMPLFFWISGYLLPRESFDICEYKRVLLKRTYTLFIPFVCSGTLMNLLTNGEGYSNLWFLRSLYELTFLGFSYELIRHKFKLGLKSDLLFFCILCIVIRIASKIIANTEINELLDLPSIMGKNYIGFVFGIFCKRYIKLMKWLNNNYTYTVCLLTFTSLSCCYFLNIDKYMSIHYLLIIIPLTAIICMVYICMHTIKQGNKFTQLSWQILS